MVRSFLGLSEPLDLNLGLGLAGQAQGMDLRFESRVRGQGEECPGQAGRTLPLHFSLNDLFLNFLITKGESYPFKVTDGPDYLKKTRSIHRRAF